MRGSYAVMILLCVAGCTKGVCSRNSECAAGFVCSAYGTCVFAPDASTETSSDAPDEQATPPIVDAATGDVVDAVVDPTLDGDL